MSFVGIVAARKKILEMNLRDHNVNLNVIAEKLDGYSGEDIVSIFRCFFWNRWILSL